MSARAALVAGVSARLRDTPALGGMAVFDAPPVRAGLPYAVVEEPVLGDRSAAGWSGREGRVSVVLFDAGERPTRLRQLMGEVEDRLPDMAGELGGGWRVARLALARSRIARTGGERWMGRAEFTARVWRADA